MVNLILECHESLRDLFDMLCTHCQYRILAERGSRLFQPEDLRHVASGCCYRLEGSVA